ncbi:MAG: hypothetical protein QF704_07200 [Anaerolineales bacterium]|nr:hypothetical protein [Anaerolineales bacterium]
MKFIVLFLGSTTLVTGGTAITLQQETRNGVITNQRPYQEHRTALAVMDCVAVETPIFDDVAYELQVADGSCYFRYTSGGNFLPHADIDGDGHLESNNGSGYVDPSYPESYYFNPSVRIRMSNTNPLEIISEGFLSLDPIDLDYDGIDFSKITPIYQLRHVGYLDVNGDGKPDALVELVIDKWGPDPEMKIFYVENISEWTTACATDINNDGSTNTNDLLAVVGNWGPCE